MVRSFLRCARKKNRWAQNDANEMVEQAASAQQLRKKILQFYELYNPEFAFAAAKEKQDEKVPRRVTLCTGIPAISNETSDARQSR